MSKTILRAGTLAFAAIAVLALSASAFEWPVDAGKIRYGFGSFRSGFLRGTEFGATEGFVRAADDGELTFVATGSSLPGGYPIPGGALMVVSHASDMMTIYEGLQRGSSSSYLKNVRAGDILGRTITATNGRGVSFYAFDARKRRFINPLILMPRISDDKPPAIRSAALSLEGQETVLGQTQPVRQGLYYLLLDAFDTSPAGAAGAPFELRVLLDGSERGRVVYDAAWADGGQSLLFGATGLVEDSFQTIDGRMRFGPFNLSSGRVILTVIASDYAGNKREQTYSVSVQ
ncbi:MAG: hypothetical protein A2Y38_09725 [Spirochaetes bacterium GWB1_59_5]|nr:MAG: hypothetical protein A2Y38_09725 [Spirochaetes bacterium GWB1_59_5]